MMKSLVRCVRDFLLLTVLLTGCCCSSEGHPPNLLREDMDRLPPTAEDADNTIWILTDDVKPIYSQLQASLTPHHTRDENIHLQPERTQPSYGESTSDATDYDSDSIFPRRFNIFHRALRNYSPRAEMSQRSWPRNVNKRGIGLFSLAVALAQNNSPSLSKPRMQPVDLTAYPRRARFFVATMG